MAIITELLRCSRMVSSGNLKQVFGVWEVSGTGSLAVFQTTPESTGCLHQL